MFLCLLFTLSFQNLEWAAPSHTTSLDYDELAIFRAPIEVDTDADGNFYFADVLANQVVKMAPNGKVLFSFGRKGQAPGEFTTVYDIAVDKHRERVWVSDQLGWRIARYDLDGNLQIHKDIREVQPYAIAVLSNGALVVGGSGENNLVMFDENLENPRAVGYDTRKPMENAGANSHLFRFMSITAANDAFYVAYYNQPMVESYDLAGKRRWRSERPWLNADRDPKDTQVKMGGMAFEAEDYHRNLAVIDGVLYVATAPAEHAVVAFALADGQYLGHQLLPEGWTFRGLTASADQIVSLQPVDGVIRIHARQKDQANPFALTLADDYENRYTTLSHIQFDKTPPSCNPNGCTCDHGGKACTDNCCSR